MSTNAANAPSLTAVLQSLHELKVMLVCDHEGVVLLRAGDEVFEPALQRMAVVFAQTTEQANKLGLGRNKYVVAFHESSVFVNVSLSPLVLTLMADAGANLGLLLDALPRLCSALEPMQHSFENFTNAHQ
eukprot:CAMPEP_0119400370 /NCGR_PEP_ID=MMETSP1334-20130426/141830_1 /TAXON_ID=127549 /ORGANISM="Calcidiscus leptoporus, Strain RCC1130" /LENGTH=129 /DNA_ID=CAMNT_0007424275 /DNA_START=16 /DNA_END=405 /DNA_ORIENTATION=+